jgi:PAS domain S-box-containing protein
LARSEQDREVRLTPENRALLDALTDPIVAADHSNRVVYANAAAERLLGWTVSELQGKPLTAIMPDRFRAAHESGFQRFMSTGRPRIMGRPIRVPALHKHGLELDVELSLSAVQRPGTSPLILATLRDLRERVELERRIHSQRKILAQYAAVGILAEATDAAEVMPRVLRATAEALQWEVGVYWGFDASARLLRMDASWSASPAAGQMFTDGCRDLTFGSGEGLPGQVLATARPVWSKDVRTDDRYARARLAAEHGLRSALLFPVYCARRTWGVLEYLTAQVEEPDEELLQTMAGLGFQIGQFLERVENEAELRRAWAQAEAEKQNLQALFDAAPAAIVILKGPELRYVLSNPVNQMFAGDRQLLGKTIREALPEVEASGVLTIAETVYRTGKPFSAGEFPVTMPATPDRPARTIYMRGVCQPLRGPDNAVEGVMFFSWDVTDLVEGRARVQEAEARLRLTIEAADVGTWDYHPKTRAFRCDARYKALFGASPSAEINPETLGEAIHPDDRQRVAQAVARSFDPAQGGDFLIDYRVIGVEDGRERWLSMRGRTLFDEQGLPDRFVGTGVDITRERRAVDRLRLLGEASRILASQLKYRETLTAMAQLTVPGVADWCAVDLVSENGQLENVVRMHADPVKARWGERLRFYSPRPDSPSLTQQVLRTGKGLLATEISDELLQASAQDAEHLRLLRTIGVRSAVIVPLRAADRPLGVLSLAYAESGRRYDAEDLAFAEDLGTRVAMAIENSRLYSQAQEAIGIRDQFLSIASHELKTPLTSLTLQVSGLARLVAAGAVDPPKLQSRVTRMEQQTGRLATLIEDLLDVSRISTGRLVLQPEPMDLVALAREVIENHSDEADRAGNLVSLRAPDQLVGRWDRNRLDQVLSNLLANALKYAAGQPVDLVLDSDGAEVVIAVSDRGPGISPQDQRRIFKQFERASSPNMAGLGLGLWIVSRVVEGHGGSVSVTSEPGEGATFTVRLPRAAT